MKMRMFGVLLVNMALAVCVARAEEKKAEELVDNPAYQSWAQYKAGTSVTMESKTQVVAEEGAAPMEMMTMTVTSTLKEVKPEEAVVEMKMTMTMMGQSREMPARETKVPAKIEKSKLDVATMAAGKQGDVKVTDVKDGKDTIEVAGKKLDCQTKEMNIEAKQGTETMKGTAKIWSNNEVPGGMVKNVMTTKEPMVSTMTTVVTAYDVKK